MNLVIDGIIYNLQAHGGISRIFTEILPRMCQQDKSLNIDLLMTGKSKQILPSHSNIHVKTIPSVIRLLKPDIVWQGIVSKIKTLWQQSIIGNSEDKIWHSTYYSMPENWKGKVVVTVPDLASEFYPQLFNAPGSELFREHKRQCILSADAVICISKSTQKDVIEYYGINSGNIRVVPLACGDIFQEGEYPLRSKPFLLYVGSRSHYKNFKLLVDAYHKWERKKDVNLVVAGYGWSEEELEYNQSITLIENPNDITLTVLYNQAAALVYPSLYEGFGIPLLEAMACGCPIVASNIPSTLEIARECPIYFDSKDIGGLVSAFDAIIDEGRKSQRTKDGLDRVKDYSWDKTARQTLEIYHHLKKR